MTADALSHKFRRLGRRETLEYVRTVAPDDVQKTIAWLSANDWHAEHTQRGRQESFGNVLVELVRSDDRITVTRDRGQWTLHLRLSGWPQRFDLHIVLDTIAGRTDWSSPLPKGALPEQHRHVLPGRTRCAETEPTVPRDGAVV